MLFHFGLQHGYLGFELLHFALLVLCECQLLNFDLQLILFLVQVIDLFLLLLVQLLELVDGKGVLLLQIEHGSVFVLASSVEDALLLQL